jgi:putative membrane protein
VTPTAGFVETVSLLFKTILLRPYVFVFLAAFLFSARLLIGWKRTAAFFFLSWITAFVCEFASTRIGIPFGDYYYTGSTVGQELYLSNVPFMDSLSFTFLLYASYCLALAFLLPAEPALARRGPTWIRLRFDKRARTSGSVLLLTALFYAFIDIVIDPVALRGDRWFLGQIYGYPVPGVYFGIPIANFVGWAVVGLIGLSAYAAVDRKWANQPPSSGVGTTAAVLLGCGLYYGVLAFNLSVTFWIGEATLGTAGIFIFLPITVLALLRLTGRIPVVAAHGQT